MPVYAWNEVTGQVRKDYDGMTYAEREALKRDAWKRYCAGLTVAAKVAALTDIIRAHYDRSREAYKGKHPDFTTYACHWVASDILDDPEVQRALEKQYPAPKVRHIPTGRSYWEAKPIPGHTHRKASHA